MKEFILSTDSTADLPAQYLEENHINMLTLSYMVDGENYDAHNGLESHDFYNKMRTGSQPKTAAVNIQAAKRAFRQIIEQGNKRILHLSFSSALSSSYSSEKIAAEELMSENPDCKIIVVDTLCASLGQGLLVHKVLQLQKKGCGLEEAASWAEENKLHVCHNFTVEDLIYLHRGGRISKATQVVGTLIDIKPVLHVNNKGELVPVGKVRGRKKSLNTLVDNMDKLLGSWNNDVIFISHGDCLEDAQYVADIIQKRFGVESFLINDVSPTIGAHSGPGTVALFFMGDHR